MNENFDLKFIETGVNDYSANDGVCRAYAKGSKKRFMEWFNPQLGVPEVSLCDEVFLQNEKDFAEKLHVIELLEVGESCIVEENVCVVTRVQ